MTNEPFEPYSKQFRHLGCCDARVTVSARAVIIASLIALLFKAISSSTMGEWASTLGQTTIGTFFFEFICILLLNIAVFKEHGLLIWPYIVSQIFVVANIVRSSMVEYQKEKAIYWKRPTPTNIAAAQFVGRIIWISMSAYFVFIVINFSLFLKQRAEAYKEQDSDHATTPTNNNARQTILDDQLSSEPRYPSAQPLDQPENQAVPHHQPPSPAQSQIQSVPHYHPHYQPPPPAQSPTQAVPQNHSPCHNCRASMRDIFDPPPPYQP